MDGTIRVLKTGQDYRVLFAPKGQTGGALPPCICADLDALRDVLSDLHIEAEVRKTLLTGAGSDGGVSAAVSDLPERTLRHYGLIL